MELPTKPPPIAPIKPAKQTLAVAAVYADAVALAANAPAIKAPGPATIATAPKAATPNIKPNFFPMLFYLTKLQ
jgi:hypothetical protein